MIDVVRAGADPYLAAAVAEALAHIPSGPAQRALDELTRHRSIIVRRAAQEAIIQKRREPIKPTDGDPAT